MVVSPGTSSAVVRSTPWARPEADTRNHPNTAASATSPAVMATVVRLLESIKQPPLRQDVRRRPASGLVSTHPGSHAGSDGARRCLSPRWARLLRAPGRPVLGATVPRSGGSGAGETARDRSVG